MRSARFALGLSFAIVTACAGKARPPAVATEAASNDAVKKLAALAPANAEMAMLVDVQHLRRTPVFAQLKRSNLFGSHDDKACGERVMETVDAILYFKDADGGDGVAIHIPGGASALGPDCAALGKKKASLPTSIDGHAGTVDVEAGKERVSADDGEYGYVGSRAFVTTALRGDAAASPYAPALKLSGDRVVAMYGSTHGMHIEASLEITANDVALHGRFATRDEDEAKRVEGNLNNALAGLEGKLTGSPRALAALQRIQLHRENAALAADVRLDLADAAVAVEELQAYSQRHDETMAAATNVGKLVTKMVAAVQASPNHVFPPSAGPVPSTVPKGVAIEETDADWGAPTWKQLQFSLHGPQRFQYEILTNSDGTTCIIRTRGDVDGDGVITLVEVRLQVNPETKEVERVGDVVVENEDD